VADENLLSEYEEKSPKKSHKDALTMVLGTIGYSLVLVAILFGAYFGFKDYIQKKEIERAEKESEIRLKKAKEEGNSSALSITMDETVTEVYEWKDEVFSRIENLKDPKSALINSYNVKRVKPSEDVIYTVFTSPEGTVEKITEKDTKNGYFDLYDYYYSDGKINYIAQYKEVVDIPINISTSKVESRFYFAGDKLVRYIFCEGDSATEFNVGDLEKYSDGTKDQYKFLEKDMLERSSRVYKEAGELKNTEKISGYVLDEYEQVLPDTSVSLRDSEGNVVMETTSNGDGYYEMDVETSSNEYYLFFERGDVKPVKVCGVDAPDGSINLSVKTVYMAYVEANSTYDTQVFVKDSEDASVILTEGDIQIKEGFGNRDGETVLTGNLSLGGVMATPLPAGCYTLLITVNGYEPLCLDFYVSSNHQATVGFVTKTLAEGEIKCVLSFEANPLDLDIKGFSSNDLKRFKSIADSVGSTTSEVLKIEDAGNDFYTAFISSFSDILIRDTMSYNLSSSNALIQVYMDGKLKNYYAPASSAGVVYKPFEIRDRKLINIGEYYNAVSEGGIFTVK